MNLSLKKLALLPSLALLMSASAVLIEPAEARVCVSGGVSVRFDSCGFPVWGYMGSRPIYAYDPYGRPIHVVTSIYPGCYVPNWEPAPHYRGRYYWPVNIHRRRYTPHNHCGPHYRPLPPRPRPCYSHGRGRR